MAQTLTLARPARNLRPYLWLALPLLVLATLFFYPLLLIAEQATVEELADRLGYTNPYHFIRQFKSITGRTPGQYRKEYKSMEAKKKPAF